jgi:hypothetical protein
MKSTEDHSTNKGNYKTDLTLTGILIEGFGNQAGKQQAIKIDGWPTPAPKGQLIRTITRLIVVIALYKPKIKN